MSNAKKLLRYFCAAANQIAFYAHNKTTVENKIEAARKTRTASFIGGEGVKISKNFKLLAVSFVNFIISQLPTMSTNKKINMHKNCPDNPFKFNNAPKHTGRFIALRTKFVRIS